MHEKRFQVVLRTACWILEGKPAAKVLEVGVWPGFIALVAGFTVRGIDLEPERLDTLEEAIK